MLTNIKRLTIPVWMAIITFTIGVALAMLWVVPRVRVVKPAAEMISSSLMQQQQIRIPDGWRKLEFDNSVYLMIPPDMQSKEPFGDSRQYREVYANRRLYLTIVGRLLVEVPEDILRRKKLYPCKAPETDGKDSHYSESVMQIDGRQAKLWITHTADRGIGARLCFPNADDSIFDLELLAHCKDEQTLAIARQIFSSIRFKE